MVAPKNQKRTLLNGLNPLSYQGVEPSSPNDFVSDVRDPISGTTQDYQGWDVGDEWLNRTTLDVFKLVSKDGGVATWVKMIAAAGDVKTLKDDAGTVIDPAADGSISVVGGELINTVASLNTLTVNLDRGLDGQIPIAATLGATSYASLTSLGGTILFTPGANTLNLETAGTIATSYLTDDANSAIPALNVLTVTGAHNNNTTSLGSTVTINGNNAIVLGDLAPIAVGSDAITCTTGDVSLTSGRLNLCASAHDGTIGSISMGNSGGPGEIVVMSFPDNQICIGGNAFAPNMIAPASGNLFVGGGYSTITSGQNNTTLGGDALGAITTGSNNVCIGQFCGDYITTGGTNVLIGNDVCSSAVTGLVTGSGNTCIGQGAGDAYTGAESNNILIKNAGVVGESNVTRIGGIAAQSKCFIDGIRGKTTDVADAIAVLIDSNGQLGTISSSLRFKENVDDMGRDSEKIYDLRPVTFNYKSDESKKKQYGLIAEEVDETFPYLAVKDHDGNIETVKYHELNTLLLNELIKLRSRVEVLEAKLNCKE